MTDAAMMKPPYELKEYLPLAKCSRALIYKMWSQGRGPRKVKVGRKVLIVEEPSEWLARIGE